MKFKAICTCAALAIAMIAAICSPAAAHPHVFVEARSELVFDDAGIATAVRHSFRFDDAYTAFAIQGFDTNGDGIYSREELSELADINVESMGEFGYFTFGDNGRIELDFNPPEDYWLQVVDVPMKDYWVIKPEDVIAMREDVEMNGGEMPESVKLLELHFTLPLKEATDASKPITLDIYDPTYYVDFRFGQEKGAVGIENAPRGCNVVRKEPPPLDQATAYALAQIGPDQRDLPPELQAAAQTQVNQMIVTCSGAAGASVDDSGTTETDGFSAIDALAPLSPLPRATNPSGADSQTGMFSSLFGKIAQLQSEFYQKLVGALRAFRSNPNAGWLLVGLSFAYGIFHAAGPGHGKAIISSYVVANNETLKKGIFLSFVSAFAQAVTAIALVGGAAVLLNLTSIAIQDTARWFEIGSYVLVTGLGVWLLWSKAVRPSLLSFQARPGLALAHGHHHHHQDHEGHDHHGHEGHHHFGADGVCTSCGHAHAPTPDMLQGTLTLTKAVSIVLAIGLRPCSGALVVLVFALSQGMIAAGIASTLAMAVGTGITVAILAGLAVGVKDLAVRLFGEGSAMATRVHRTIEIVGALIVFLLGLTLLIAALGWR